MPVSVLVSKEVTPAAVCFWFTPAVLRDAGAEEKRILDPHLYCTEKHESQVKTVIKMTLACSIV